MVVPGKDRYIRPETIKVFLRGAVLGINLPWLPILKTEIEQGKKLAMEPAISHPGVLTVDHLTGLDLL
jgi:hypothetical protein